MRRKFHLTVTAALALALAPAAARADANGEMEQGPDYPCATDKIASIAEVCKAVKDVLPFVQCPNAVTKCFRASQEVFTGLSGETASPGNIKIWNGQGVSGPTYQSVGLCLLRDLNATPMKAEAQASLPAGTIAAKSVVDYMNFDPKTKVFKGSRRLTATAPALGDIDLLTQTFTVKAVDSPLAGPDKKVGEYAVAGAHALEFDADAGNEDFSFELDGIVITTPYGTVTPKPYVKVARSSFWSLSPFGGSTGLTMNPGGFETKDVYGRLKGQTVASALQPAKWVPEEDSIVGKPFCGVIVNDKRSCLIPHPVGWNSQVMLGSRNVDPRPQGAPWKAPAGQAYPLRPDADIAKARGDAEKLPNALANAGVRIEYDVLGILPQALLSQAFISVPERKLWVDPNIWVAFGGQFNFWNAQASTWNPALAKSQPVVSPNDVESLHSMALYGGASVAGRSAIDAGVDLRINLHIPLCCFVDDIDFDIINIHPRATLAELVDADTKPADRQAFAMTSAQTAAKTGKPFQSYAPLTGGQADGFKHLVQCFADPPPPPKEPSKPKYTPGDPNDLIKELDMQCNLCVGYADLTYVEVKTENPLTFQTKTVTGFAEKTPFVSDAALPQAERWTCGGPLSPKGIGWTPGPPDPSKITTKAAANEYNKAVQAKAKNGIKNLGCFDQCRVDPATGKFTKIGKSAKTLFAEGKITDAPNGCY